MYYIYMYVDILQIGSHIGNTSNDPIFNNINIKQNIILVEPVPFLFKKLIENYNIKYPNNNFIFINKACSNKKDELKLYVPSKDYNDFETQLISVRENHIKKCFYKKKIDFEINELIVDAITLNDIINDYNITNIDYLVIDTEGHEYEILMELNLNIIKPKKIMFEHKHIDGIKKCNIKYRKLIKYFSDNGYSFERKPADTILHLNDMFFINNYFDKIIFIHCKHRLDRMENIKLLLEKTKLTNYIILNATYLPKNGAKGCAHSHYRAMDMAIKNNWDKVLIIEDDFQFNDNIGYKFEEVIKENNDWDVLMPYWWINGINRRSKKINKNIRQVTHHKYGAYTTSCYAVNKNIIPILRDKFLLSYSNLSDTYTKSERLFVCDCVWFSVQNKCKWYLIEPKLGYIANCPSIIAESRKIN